MKREETILATTSVKGGLSSVKENSGLGSVHWLQYLFVTNAVKIQKVL